MTSVGHSMSYDDLKVIEATVVSARDGAWHKVTPVPGATFGHA